MGKGGRKRLSEKFDQELATRDDTLSTALAGAISLYIEDTGCETQIEFSFSPVLDMVTQHGDEKVEEWKKNREKSMTRRETWVMNKWAFRVT